MEGLGAQGNFRDLPIEELRRGKAQQDLEDDLSNQYRSDYYTPRERSTGKCLQLGCESNQ